MEQEIYNRLIVGVVVWFIVVLLAYFGRKSIEKIGFALIFFLGFSYGIFSNLQLLYNYDVVIGTTNGTYLAGKSGTKIRYSFLYKDKVYQSGASMNYGAKTENGYYYVRVAKQFPSISEIDFSSPVKDYRKRDSLHFIEFENLIIGKEYIPRTMFAQRVNLDDSQLYHEKSKYFGKTITYFNGYKLVYLRQNDGLKGHEILVTYNQLNQQIDVKTFLYYCPSCAKGELIAHLSFLSSSDEFIVKYFTPENQNVLPEESEIKALKREKWTIDEKGFFVLK